MCKIKANQFRGGLAARRSPDAVYRGEGGMTLAEVMLAVAVIVIAALGSLNYEYLCVDQVRFARAQMTATRIGQLLIEDWKSTGGDDNYSPEDLDMGFTLPPDLDQGDFMTVIDGLPLYITTEQDEVEPPDPITGVRLSRLTITVRWRTDFGAGTVSDDSPSLTFNTYVRRDQ